MTVTIFEIKGYIQTYQNAAVNAVHRAGFGGVEIHGANDTSSIDFSRM